MRCDFIDRIETRSRRGVRQPVRIITAVPRKAGLPRADVARIWADGREEARGLWFHPFGGWLVDYPDGRRLNRSDWGRFPIPVLPRPLSALTDEGAEALAEFRPQFRHVLRKWRTTPTAFHALAMLRVWEAHPECEHLVALGLEGLAFGTAVWMLRGARRTAFLRFVRDNAETLAREGWGYGDIMECVRSGLSADEFGAFRRARRLCDKPRGVSARDWAWLSRRLGRRPEPSDLSLLVDVRRMAEALHHDAESDYWRYPSDVVALHARLVEESERAKIGVEVRLSRRARNIPLGEWEVGGYRVLVTLSAGEWEAQAAALHQCIMTAGYYGKMCAGKSLLAFVRGGDGRPVATAEVGDDGQILQFYADELDRNDCLPSDEVRGAFGRWLAEGHCGKWLSCA